MIDYKAAKRNHWKFEQGPFWPLRGEWVIEGREWQLGKQKTIAEVQRRDGASSGDGEKRMDWRQKFVGELRGLAGGWWDLKESRESLVTLEFGGSSISISVVKFLSVRCLWGIQVERTRRQVDAWVRSPGRGCLTCAWSAGAVPQHPEVLWGPTASRHSSWCGHLLMATERKQDDEGVNEPHRSSTQVVPVITCLGGRGRNVATFDMTTFMCR